MLAAFTTLGYAYAHGFVMWLALRCVWGAAWTLLRLGAFYCILNVSSDGDRGYFMGLYNGLYRLGSLGGMLAGGLLADLLGFSATALLFGACTALTIVPSLVFVPRGKGPQPVSASGAPSEAVAWRESTVLWVMATGLVVALIYQGLYASTLSRLINVHVGSSVTVWGVAVGAATLAGALQALRWAWEPWLAPWFGRLSDRRFGRRAVMTASLGAGAIFFGLAALTLPLPLWIGALLGAQLAGTSLTTCADAVASDAASVAGGRTFMMWYSFAADLGAALGPLIAYLINDLWSMDAAYAGTAGLLLLFTLKWFRAAPVATGPSLARKG